jgi:hypothetical protein
VRLRRTPAQRLERETLKLVKKLNRLGSIEHLSPSLTNYNMTFTRSAADRIYVDEGPAIYKRKPVSYVDLNFSIRLFGDV